MPIPDSHNRGWVPEKFDARDKTYYYDGDAEADFTKANLLNRYPGWKVYNQNSTDSCVANAMAAAINFVARKDHVLTLDPSRLFLYYNARALEIMENQGMDTWPPKVKDAGSNIRYAAKAISKLGIASDAKFPWIQEGDGDKVLSINDRPPDAAYEEASAMHAVEYCRLDPDHSEDVEDQFTPKEKEAIGIITLARTKQCLVEGYPVVFGFKFYWGDFKEHLANNQTPLPGDKWCSFKPVPQPHDGPKGDWGAHAGVAVAFEVDKTDSSKGRVLVQNSWGPGPDSHPYFYMPFDWISDFEATDDFWMIRKVDGARKRQLPASSPLRFTRPGWNLTQWSRDLKAAPALNAVFAAVSRARGTAEAFWITPAGQLDCMAYYRDMGWGRRNIISEDGSAALGAIAAVNSQTGGTEIFWITPGGAVNVAFIEINMGGFGMTLQMLAPAGSASVKSGLTVVSRSPGHREVWWVVPDGSIQGKWNQDGNGMGWQGYTLAPAGSAHVESNLASVATSDHKLMLVWWVTKDGRPGGKLWDEGSGWRDTYSDSDFKSGDVALHSRLAAVSPEPGIVEVYWVSRLGEVKSSVWRKGFNTWGLVEGVAPKSSARVDSGLTAVAMNNRVDVHWVGADNSLGLATKDYGGSESDGSWKVVRATDSGSVWAGSPLGIFTRDNGQYSVIFQDCNGAIVLGDVYQ
ncbi:hypothetical protein QBC42DRAFT_295878 [Cladorrhinum samala]|uniref:Peptidase C1A papain C-terminal domain-containing protein n=1 Tax=Cladorrhinum samala TaxID=585594 RepID=A0AAV9HUA5_9PEZI|nr:hypothetical protein QBC42DRAFT_295878 [Cladorrhinum samala]